MSKWITFFGDNPKLEDEKTMVYMRRVYERAKLISPELKNPRSLLDKYKVYYKRLSADKPDYKTAAKILVLDIETAPLKAWVWSKWKQNINDNHIISDWFMLCWSAKWLFDKNTMSAVLTPEEAVSQDDKRITEILWDLINQADIVIAHNALKFDIKRINTRFLIHAMPPPAPYKVIDTLLHLRNQFANSSNRLDAINNKLGLQRKMNTGGFELWSSCCDGQLLALRQMELYNIQDVIALEEHYLRIRPWIQPHPNIGLYILDGVERCPSCGSDDLTFGGDYCTTVNVFTAFRCKSCGSLGRSKKSKIPVSKSKHIISSLPKSK